ncbi:hypothetical protein [Natrinema salifodinae]|uniref:Winged helix-turn-helix n=1 Tax=Natrinema salifodinae TaxID=1202768 RepID=A0A1I0LXW8_9EURY|nr:hypothetical protein [Natrinema salifodinae]SEV80641.1 hypothetical protein SAMN05216285_0136 [Natrinema salifodinae]
MDDEPADSDRDAGAEANADSEPETDAEWMQPADRPILELMQDDDVFEPSHIDEERICRGPHAAYRCRELTKYGLLERLMPGMYDITELGEQYLAGELDPSELEPDESINFR